MKEAVLYKYLGDKKIVCTACARYCKLNDQQIGFCGVRKNIGGKLYLLNYGLIITAHIDPVEKKPLTHFNPGTSVFSIATTGCNWMCKYCQNFDISQRRRIEGFEVSPEKLVSLAKDYGADGFAYTYNEPTIFMEFAHDVGILAHKHGMFNTFVTNGYMTPEAVEMAAKFLDAATVDFKGNGNRKFLQRYVGISGPDPIFDTLIDLQRKGVFIEITDLVVPEIGDNLDDARLLARWIVDNLGPDVPLHFLRFHPDYKMTHLPWTPVETLEKHWKIAKEEGLKYVYLGNVPGHPLENTYCPNCGRVVVERYSFNILSWHLTEDFRCKFCGYKLNFRGKLGKNFRGERFVFVPIHTYAQYKTLEF